MLEQPKKYFLYTHTRVDNGDIMYVGIGTQPKNGLLYSRAYNTFSRNPSWRAIVRITNYKVNILLEADTREEVEIEEKRLIALYGRRDLGTGSLVNRTEGGEKVGAPHTKTKRKSRA